MKVTKFPAYPCVMGIVNITPDSFYATSRVQEETALRARVRQIVREGGSMVDVGAYSTRPGAAEVSADEEMSRLSWALPIITSELESQCVRHVVPVSVDTYRAQVAERCVTEFDADVINDISGGTLDEAMFDVVRRTHAHYILMHMRGTPQDMQQHCDYPMGVTREVIRFFARQLEALGTTEGVILDPGYGFAKTLEQNYELMQGIDAMKQAFSQCPLLVGISRKSMIYRLLGADADQALNGTTVLNTYAALHGADILRVHDVREAVETLRIVEMLRQNA